MSISKIKLKLRTFILYAFRLFPIKKNRVLFTSFHGKGYGDSLKPIADKLLDDSDIQIVWIVKKIYDDMPAQIKQVKSHGIGELYYLATSKVWFNNQRFDIFVRKRKGQIYIQTWHSSLRLKKIEGDAVDYLPESYIEQAKNDSSMIDYIPCGCEFSKNTYANSFWYDGPVLMCGTPRLDKFFDAEECGRISKELKDKYGIHGKKIILYAPTFRNADRTFTGTLDFNSFASDYLPADEYVVLVRMHPLVAADFKTSSNVINVTDYPNMQDLIILCDYLVTDYSGCCFDTLVQKKPCVMYIPDLEEYLAKDRDLYFSFDELPFEKAVSPEELKDIITGFDRDAYEAKVGRFAEKIGFVETGEASEYLSKMIKEIVHNEKV